MGGDGEEGVAQVDLRWSLEMLRHFLLISVRVNIRPDIAASDAQRFRRPVDDGRERPRHAHFFTDNSGPFPLRVCLRPAWGLSHGQERYFKGRDVSGRRLRLASMTESRAVERDFREGVGSSRKKRTGPFTASMHVGAGSTPVIKLVAVMQEREKRGEKER